MGSGQGAAFPKHQGASVNYRPDVCQDGTSRCSVTRTYAKTPSTKFQAPEKLQSQFPIRPPWAWFAKTRPIAFLRACLKNGLLVAQATRLFRPATRRNGSIRSRQWGPPFCNVFRGSSGRRVAELGGRAGSCIRHAKRLRRFCLSLPARHERGESRREGKLIRSASSPGPSPPFEEARERKSGCAERRS